MRKTSVYLDETDAGRLAALAEAEGVSQAAVLRKAIRAYVPDTAWPKLQFEMDGVADGPGESVADIDERELLVGFGQ